MGNKFESFGSFPEEKAPDRPLECTECKKPVAVYYTEIVGPAITRNCMCVDCPVLQRKLYGDRPTAEEGNLPSEVSAELVCGNCGTTLESVQVGGSLGCSMCYDVFEDVLISELSSMEKIPSRLVLARKSQLLHQGRVRGESVEISPSMRLLALNEALNEMLKREDYEQAAQLRDQIKALTDEQQAKEDKKESTDGQR